MNVFAFLIGCLKKGWGNESSHHHFRVFLPVILHRLCLPITLVSRVLHALSRQAHNVKRLMGCSVKGFSGFYFRSTGLVVSDAVRLWREAQLADFKSNVPRKLSPHYLLLLMLFLGSVQNAMALDDTSFITKWQTTAADETITIPVYSSYTYSYDIDCDNDSTFEQTGVTNVGTCAYATAGEHIIKIRGTFPAIYINSGAGKEKILDVMQWGNIAWKSMAAAFEGASNLQISATDSPNLSSVTDMSYMFFGATAFNQDISGWDVSNVTNMSNMFQNVTGFNQKINNWDTGNVTHMVFMFNSATAFNQDISGWDVSKVTSMSGMFISASAFNQDISSWDVSNITDMYSMFYKAAAFNQDISGWDVSNVTDMSYMFYNATLSTANYDALLVEWNKLTLQPNVSFDAGNSKYTAGSAAETARTNMINTDKWTITDGGSVAAKLAQTITFTNPGNKTFGETFTLSATASSGLSVSYTSTTTSVCTVGASTGDVTIVTVGDCTITASQAGDATYAAATDVPQTFTLAKKDITATAENKSRAYGASNPTATFTYSDGATGIDTEPTASFSGDVNSAVGSAQTITCTGGSDDNYNITSCADGTLTITQASTTTAITSDNPEPSATGKAVTVNFTVTPASGSDPTGQVTVTDGAESCTATLPASSCDITFSSTGSKSLTATYAGDTNFSTSTSSAETHTVASLGVMITESSNSTDVTEDGGNDTYTINLMTVPTGTVKITLTPDAQTNVGAGVGVAKTLNFTDVAAQTVTVTADDDATFEGNHTGTITHAITTSADTDYPTTLSIASVTANITDNEPGVMITQSSGSTSVTEGGATDSFEVVLSTQPADYVSITISPDAQTDVDKTSLEFTRTNWNTAQTVTVTANDDSNYEGNHNGTIGLSVSMADQGSEGDDYDDATFVVEGTAATELSVSITDNDSPPPAPEATPSPTPSTSSSSSSSSSTITTTPTGGPIVEFAGDGSGSVTASELSSGEFSCHSSETCPTQIQIGWYRFEPTADQGSQFVEWRGQNCEKGEYTTSFGGTCIAVFKKRPEPKPADGTPLAPQPNVMPGIQLSSSTLNVTEGSLAASYSLWLNTEPSDPVSIHFESDGELIYDQQAITFDRDNWQQPQTLKVLDRNDDIADGAHTHTIYHTVTSNDTDYHNILVDNVIVKVTDDDSAGIHLSRQDVEIVEGTQDGHYSIVLTTQPTSEVLIKLSQADHNHQVSEADHTFIKPDSLRFTPLNWNIPQDVRLSVNDDAVSEGKHTHAAIVHTITSADSAYNSLNVDDVTVHVVDNDVANLMFLNAAIHLTEGAASSDFEIALTVMPTHPVRVTLTSGMGINVSPTTLIFENNSASQTVKVAAIDDEITEGEHQADIRFQTTSDDPEYHDIRLENLTVNITDNDMAGIKFSQYDVTVGNESQNAQYTVNLMTEPTASVTVSLISSEPIRVSPSQLVFDPNNWQVPQRVIVSAVDEIKGEAPQINTIVSKVTSDDPNYNTLPTQNVTVFLVERDGLIPEGAEPSFEPEIPTTQDEFALPTNTVVSSAPVNQCNTSSDKLIGVCHAHTQTIRYQAIGKEDSLSNGILDHALTSQGMVSNTTITEKGHLFGGKVSGYTQNEGLIENVEFVGASISGKNASGEVVGTIGGKITLASLVGGVVEDVRLAPNTEISGSGKRGSHGNRDRLGGTLIGDSEKPAILKRVHIKTKSVVSNVIITENVTFGEGIIFTNVEFRTPLVQKVTLTGQITGTRFQNTYTKIEAVTISANSHLSHLVIGDKVRFEEGVTLEDSVTFEVHIAYMETHSITVLPKLKGLTAIDKQGNRVSTWARLQGGARMENEGSRKKPYQNKLTLKRNPSKNVSIVGNVLTDVRHIGLGADILVVAAYTPPGATLPSFYMLDNKRRPLPWDGALSSLVAFQSRTALAPVVSVPIWNNPVDIVGELQIYFGYRLNEGLIVSSQDEVIEITLIE